MEKKVLRLMREMRFKAIYPSPQTTIVHKFHKKYPNLLKDMKISHPHHAWQVDITYLRTNHGFMYLNALIGVYSRVVVGWTLSNTLDSQSCLRTFEKAFFQYGRPHVIHSDQGSQFTSEEWLKALTLNDINVSMSGAGRSNDNAYIERLWRTLKYEYLIILGARTVQDYKKMIPQFIDWYHHKRPHQSLNYKTPVEVLNQYRHDGYVENTHVFTHTSTTPTTNMKDSLIL